MTSARLLLAVLAALALPAAARADNHGGGGGHGAGMHGSAGRMNGRTVHSRNSLQIFGPAGTRGFRGPGWYGPGWGYSGYGGGWGYDLDNDFDQPDSDSGDSDFDAEPSTSAPGPVPQSWYCQSLDAFYPNTLSCPEGWLVLQAPQP